MKTGRLILIASCLVAACSSPMPEAPKSKAEARKPPPEEKVQLSTAQSLSSYQRELAQHISQANAGKVYAERPQALLRAVIVLKYLLNADGKLLHTEIVRSNHNKGAETTALSSLNNAAPFVRPPAHLLRNGKLELFETWLFNDDGRFQLRTIALPQQAE
ncbi:MAG: hypothetical protein HYZ65_01845 [Burkholderiales bacterium]|nr:hypothetical protein [Burkholderiales bacterium]